MRHTLFSLLLFFSLFAAREALPLTDSPLLLWLPFDEGA